MAIRIPVKYIKGQWRMLSGGSLPVAEGALAEFSIEPREIVDKALLTALTERRWVQIFNSDTTLCIAVTPATDLNSELLQLCEDSIEFKRSYSARISLHARFIKIKFGAPTDQQKKRNEKSGGLWLKLEGSVDRGVESSAITFDQKLGIKNAVTSLNHAYTMLSEIFETQRISHTGNVYEHVFYQEADGVWHPLKDLRNKDLAIEDRQVIKTLWDQVVAGMPSDLFDDTE